MDSISPTLVAALRRNVSGRVVYPTDPWYDVLVDGARPVAIVLAEHEEDEAVVVRLAREHGVTVGMADGALAVVRRPITLPR